MIVTFKPIIHEKVWGTEEWLLTEENEPLSLDKETWDLIQVEAWGHKNPDRSKFPLALKVIDAKKDLSIQVHPDKNEAWWVIESAPFSGIIAGVNSGYSPKDDPIKHSIVRDVKDNDSISLQQGTVHMLGAGIKVFEMADCLGTTYRLFDHGRDRELQVEQAVKCIRPGFSKSNQVTPKRKDPFHPGLPYEEVGPLKLRKESIPSREVIKYGSYSKEGDCAKLYIPNGNAFRYHYILDGQVECEGQSFQKGQGFLVTASHRKGYMLNGKAEVLTVSFL